VAGDRDALELYLEGMPLPPERLERLAQEVEGVFRRYLEVEQVSLLTGEDDQGALLRPGPQPEASDSGNGLGSNLGYAMLFPCTA
jgi:hypothetical protein